MSWIGVSWYEGPVYWLIVLISWLDAAMHVIARMCGQTLKLAEFNEMYYDIIAI